MKLENLNDCAAVFSTLNQGATDAHYKYIARFANNLANGSVDLAALTNIEREARQISAACEAVRRILKAERDKEFDASNAALDARKAKRK
jgi:hypothetical protein